MVPILNTFFMIYRHKMKFTFLLTMLVVAFVLVVDGGEDLSEERLNSFWSDHIKVSVRLNSSSLE